MTLASAMSHARRAGGSVPPTRRARQGWPWTATFYLLAVWPAALAGCAAEVEPVPGTFDATSSLASIGHHFDLDRARTSSDGPSAASAAVSLLAALQELTTTAMPVARRADPDAQLAPTGTAVCTPDLCTFTNYGDDTPGAITTLDGRISRAGTTTSIDLTYRLVAPSGTITSRIVSELAITPTTLDGKELFFTEIATGTDDKTWWRAEISYVQIVADGTGCLISGSVKYLRDTDGSAGPPIQYGLRFGPACGDVSPD